jgi:intracellular sulfur oxidation DsrE/DsrF family protein
MKTIFAVIIKALLVAGAALLSTAALANDVPAGYYTDQKVVYHNNGGLPDGASYFKHMLNSINNHLSAVGKAHVEIKVVSHGAGVELFKLAKSTPELAQALDKLRADGVRFLICANTLKTKQLDWHQLYGVDEKDIVPSGVAELTRLENMGFAYIHL